MANKHIRICLISLVIRDMQIIAQCAVLIYEIDKMKIKNSKSLIMSRIDKSMGETGLLIPSGLTLVEGN